MAVGKLSNMKLSTMKLSNSGGSGGNAQPADVLTGQTFTNDNGDQTGTMVNRGAVNLTPGTTDHIISAGYHNGSGKVIGDPDLIAANIRKGVDIFGIVGTLVEGKRWASGNLTFDTSGWAVIAGLQFAPDLVLYYSTSYYTPFGIARKSGRGVAGNSWSVAFNNGSGNQIVSGNGASWTSDGFTIYAGDGGYAYQKQATWFAFE